MSVASYFVNFVSPGTEAQCHPERSSLRGCGVEGSPEERERSFARSALPILWGFFDSLADSLAQNDRYRLPESFLW
jgi:hypothetical protein